MGSDQQFCLRWNNHQNTLVSIFDNLLESGTLVDCTLAAEGRSLQAHKVVLSACSPYFAVLLREHYDKFPILILKDIKYQELQAMMNYMYRGEVNITQDQLGSFLKAAESLQIRGLTDSGVENNNSRDNGNSFHANKKVPESRKIVVPPPQSRSPPVIISQHKKYFKTSLENHNSASARLSANSELDVTPTLKRRKLLPPIKSEGLVVTPINPSPYNNVDVNACDVPNLPQSIPASEAKASIPSPSIPSSLESPVGTDITPVLKSTDVAKSKSSEVVKIKVESVENTYDMYNNNEDTNDDGSYTADEAMDDSKDENNLALSHSYQNSQTANFDNLSDRSAGQDSNSGIQDSQDIRTSDEIVSQFVIKLSEKSSSTYCSITPPELPQQYSTSSSATPATSLSTTNKICFPCESCGNVYNYKTSLARHLRFECGKAPQFKCPFCDHRTKHKSSLTTHIDCKHRQELFTDEKSYWQDEILSLIKTNSLH